MELHTYCVILITATSAPSTAFLEWLNSQRFIGRPADYYPVEAALSSFPLLRIEENRINSRSTTDVGCLNLNAFRIDHGMVPSTDKRQVFPVKILPHLLLGNYETASDANLLGRNGARYIINVTSNLPNAFEYNPSYHYLRISVDDNSSHNLSQYFPEAIAFIDAAARAGDACLVHCLAGISRSVWLTSWLRTSGVWKTPMTWFCEEMRALPPISTSWDNLRSTNDI
ncbi:hypothetical protein Q1695_012753 [Nippostrongylus brasiliensis]|nr:hypothetical protein Q1695_012753 [Nippostrongylus brasiliensis]